MALELEVVAQPPWSQSVCPTIGNGLVFQILDQKFYGKINIRRNGGYTGEFKMLEIAVK